MSVWENRAVSENVSDTRLVHKVRIQAALLAAEYPDLSEFMHEVLDLAGRFEGLKDRLRRTAVPKGR